MASRPSAATSCPVAVRVAWQDGRVDEIIQVMSEFREAELSGSRDQLAALLTEDFTSIGERGYVLDKTQWIDRHNDFRYLSVEISDIAVRSYERTAIAIATQRSAALWQGAPMDLRTRVSQVWVQLAGSWRLAAIQFSSLATE
jgi:hypothetical protein